MGTTNRIAILLTLLVALASGALAQDPPKVELKLAATKAKAGEEVKGTVIVTFAPGLHAYQNPPSESYQLPVVVKGAPGTVLKKVTYPKGHDEEVGGEVAKVYSGRTEIGVVLVAPAKPGNATLTITLDYQQCDEKNCYMPDVAKATAKLNVVAAAEVKVPPVEVPPVVAPAQNDPTPPVVEPEPETTPDPIVTEPAPTDAPPVAAPAANDPPVQEASTEVEKTEGGLAGLLQNAFRNKNYLLLFGLLLVIGLAVNLTPCVYPLIPVTISFFSNQAGDNKAARIGLGSMYMLGIALTYGLTGGIAAAAGASFGDLFTQTWFLVALGLLMVGLALSMFDLYQLTIPSFLSKHLKGRSGPVGALIMGLLVGVAAAPCAGPLIAAVFTEAAKLRDTTLAVLMFTTVGVGIGLPYLVLGAATSGTKALPKAGGWMKVVKSLLGLVVIGVGLNYLMQAFERNFSPLLITVVWVTFYVGSAVFLFVFDKEISSRLAVGLKGAAILGFGMLGGMAWQGHVHSAAQAELARLGGGSVASHINWQPFSVEAFEKAKGEGKVIVVDATANWCAECKVIERNVFEQPEAIVAMRDVLAFRVDWSTGVDPAYQKTTKEMFDIVGLPHLVFHKPGGERSEIKTHMSTPADLIEALKRAGASL